MYFIISNFTVLFLLVFGYVKKGLFMLYMLRVKNNGQSPCDKVSEHALPFLTVSTKRCCTAVKPTNHSPKVVKSADAHLLCVKVVRALFGTMLSMTPVKLG